jgi:hypothetical protein
MTKPGRRVNKESEFIQVFPDALFIFFTAYDSHQSLSFQAAVPWGSFFFL